ncbi:MAG: RsmB/NOP family class I SAM-dependent RNA methyltransferase [Boseongicola sp.]
MADAGIAPRRVALNMMTEVTAEGRSLHLLGKALEGLETSEKARAERLARETLRWAGRSDRMLGPYLRLKPDDLVLNALRLALYEIHESGVPAHAAVNAAVELVPKRNKGLVNAVLRNTQRGEKSWSDLPLPQMPKWLRKPLVAAWGKDAVAAMEMAHSNSPPIDLSVAGEVATWAEQLNAEILPTGSLRLSEAGQVSKLPGFAEGAWWVQDAAAAMPVHLLSPKPQEAILDLCAAPGGKTTQLAARGADVTALDSSDSRLERLRDNLKRTRLNANVVVADALEWSPSGSFDAILVDAPCSATGTLRRNPDLAFAKTGQELEPLAALQSTLLERAVGWLKPGGRLVFCTCSLLPQEGEDHRDTILMRYPELQLSDAMPTGVEPHWHSVGGGLRLRPDYWADRGGMDGFFMMLLQKAA